MKSIKLLILAAVALSSVALQSCKDDEFTDSIFDTKDYPLDRASLSFPLDSFLKVNFQEPYNVRFVYRMEDIGSDLQKNLIPASYEKSQQLAVLSKYLWYDVYKKLSGEVFLKKFSPRIIHLIGSASYNPSTGTETLGVAEGGLKITLNKVNALDPSNLYTLNELFFHTMHHEFGHILDQRHQRPTAFDLVSSGLYSPMDWQTANDTLSASRGFVTNYASSQAREDWVEVLSTYVTADTIKWESLLNTAQYDWEELDINTQQEDSIENEASKVLKDADGNILRDKYGKALKANRDSIGYVRRLRDGGLKWYRKVIVRDGNGKPIPTDDGKIQYVNNVDNISGKEVILRKLQMIREWLRDNFQTDIDALRDEVQKRQFVTTEDGHFKLTDSGEFINKLTAPSDEDPGRTLMDVLMDQINQYKELQK